MPTSFSSKHSTSKESWVCSRRRIQTFLDSKATGEAYGVLPRTSSCGITLSGRLVNLDARSYGFRRSVWVMIVAVGYRNGLPATCAGYFDSFTRCQRSAQPCAGASRRAPRLSASDGPPILKKASLIRSQASLNSRADARIQNARRGCEAMEANDKRR